MKKTEYIEITKNHINLVNKYIKFINYEILKRGKNHDKSKLRYPEVDKFSSYLKDKNRNNQYGSEEYKKFLEDMKITLNHHYQENRHHPEHFKNGILDMNLIDLIELICDWKATSTINKNDDLIKSIILGQERFKYSDEIKQLLINTAHTLYKYKFEWSQKDKNIQNIYYKDSIKEIIECINKEELLNSLEKKFLISKINKSERDTNNQLLEIQFKLEKQIFNI